MMSDREELAMYLISEKGLSIHMLEAYPPDVISLLTFLKESGLFHMK